ncbi:hypothetical protein HBN50_05110 [Halobacteriovorax sp. GB3]|uniref:hypothetical protein n=1 Tax=Halobacteriovorax sp. GB3 TaxID=2719615 RepID=UPI00235F6F36|nr:hypothetical protein [Halobacteriovorax sp. GB3]MDD0852464.1 hypothetical protein [Halobacteriovorax sp. GB3]
MNIKAKIIANKTFGLLGVTSFLFSGLVVGNLVVGKANFDGMKNAYSKFRPCHTKVVQNAKTYLADSKLKSKINPTQFAANSNCVKKVTGELSKGLAASPGIVSELKNYASEVKDLIKYSNFSKEKNNQVHFTNQIGTVEFAFERTYRIISNQFLKESGVSKYLKSEYLAISVGIFVLSILSLFGMNFSVRREEKISEIEMRAKAILNEASESENDYLNEEEVKALFIDMMSTLKASSSKELFESYFDRNATMNAVKMKFDKIDSIAKAKEETNSVLDTFLVDDSYQKVINRLSELSSGIEYLGNFSQETKNSEQAISKKMDMISDQLKNLSTRIDSMDMSEETKSELKEAATKIVSKNPEKAVSNPTDLGSVLEEAVDDLSSLFFAAGVTCDVDVKGGIHLGKSTQKIKETFEDILRESLKKSKMVKGQKLLTIRSEMVDKTLSIKLVNRLTSEAVDHSRKTPGKTHYFRARDTKFECSKDAFSDLKNASGQLVGHEYKYSIQLLKKKKSQANSSL